MTDKNNQIQGFVIMPFSETKHNDSIGNEVIINSEEWKYIFDKWIKRAVESFQEININCKRSETIQGNFIKGIINEIYNSEIAIVDLTGQKPNVYYELGIRHSLKLGTIIITQDFKALPSDLNSYYCVSYEYSNKSHEYDRLYKKFEDDLHFQISSVLKNIDQSDNPVCDYLNLRHYFQVKEKEKQLRLIFHIINKLQFHLFFVFGKFAAELQDKQDVLAKPRIFFTFIDFYYFDNSISNLFNLEFEHLDQENIEKLRNFYLEFRKDLFHIHQYWEGTRANIVVSNISMLFTLMENFLERKTEITLKLKEVSDSLAKELNI